MNPYFLRVTFSRPIDGYWNYGPKNSGDFTLDVSDDNHPGPGYYLRWGCFSLNFWFTAGSGRSWKEASANALKRLRWMVSPPLGVTAEVERLTKEEDDGDW